MKKTTKELLELMRNSNDYLRYLDENRDQIGQDCMKPDRALTALLADKGVKKADVIAKSGIETHYAYQLFSGVKVPSRDKMIMLCFGFGLKPDDAQRLLRVTGYPQLYVKNERDNVILYGLVKQMSIIDVNGILYDLNLQILL